MKRFEHQSGNIGGNLHDVTNYVNKYLGPEGWELVTADFTGSNSVFIVKREIVKCDGDHGGPPCQDPECWCRG